MNRRFSPFSHLYRLAFALAFVGGHGPALAADTGAGPVTIDIPSGLLGSGSALYPEYEVNNWLLFAATVPTGTRYLATNAYVPEIDAWVEDPANLPVALPPKSQTGVVYVLDVPTGALDADIDVVFPNPEGLQPGDVHLVYVYDHDNAVWAVVGTAEVAGDGSVLTLMSNASSNVLGYHFVDTKVLYNTGGGSH